MYAGTIGKNQILIRTSMENKYLPIKILRINITYIGMLSASSYKSSSTTGVLLTAFGIYFVINFIITANYMIAAKWR